MAKLTALNVKNAKPGRHADGDGLYLFVKPTGAKSWLLRVQVDGKRRDIGLGAVEMNARTTKAEDDPTAAVSILRRRVLTLSEAREKAGLLRSAAKAGLDPVAERDRERRTKPTFEQSARDTHEALKRGWADKGASAFLSSLETHAFKALGSKDVDQITAADITAALEPIWTAKPDMARKVRQRIGTVLNFAHGKGWRSTEAPGKSVTIGLPRQPKSGNYRAMPYNDVPALMAELRSGAPTGGRQALMLHILTAARPGEVRRARWGQIDFANRDWNRPAEMMKGVHAGPHTVTLNAAALALLAEIKGERTPDPHDLIFPGQRGGLMSDMTMNKVRLRSGQRIVATYEYRKEGALLFRKHRVEPGSGDRAKDFVQERPDGRGGWIANLQGVERIPYRYDDLVAAPADDMVFLVEGEKQADLLASWGFVASSLKDWRSEWSTLVGSRRVIILPDNDEAGFKQGTQAAAMLPGSVILNLPDLPEAGDIMDWRGGPEDLLDLAKAAIAEGAKASGPPTFPIADLNTWSNIAATPKSFLMPGYVPARELTLATGAGGANKSTFGQQLATCVAGGVPMLGIDVQQGSALYITAEDDEDRLHWMQEHLCKAVGVRLSALVGQLHLASLRGRLGNELATFDGDGKLRPSPSFVTLKATIVSTQAKLVVLDNAAHLFVGNENDRGQVTAFVNLLYSLCVELGVTIILVAHANKAGDSYSGSTAWLNAVRSQIVLTRPEGAVDPDERVLTLGKANYARQGEELRFRWHDFALRLENELPDDVREEHAKNVTASADNTIFLNCLRKRIEQRRAVSEKRGPNFAATEFAKMAESKSIGKSRLEQAMERLFTIGAIERAHLWRSDDRKDVFGLSA